MNYQKVHEQIISISGTHCTGKSVLIESLKTEPLFSEYEFIGSPTRKAKDSGLTINNDSENYDLTQLFCMNHDIAVLKYKKNKIVLDRSLLDTYIYSKYLHQKGKLTDNLYLSVLTSWKEAKKTGIYSFFIIPNKNDVKLVIDKDRSSDIQFREDIHILFNTELVDMRNVLYVNGSNEQRVDQIKNYFLNELSKNIQPGH